MGIVDADIGLHGGDLRASERTWQLLHQVFGGVLEGATSPRAGLYSDQIGAASSDGHPGPESDRRSFLKFELGERRYFNMPPYGRLAAVIVSAENDHMARSVAQELGRLAPRGEGIEVFGPAPAPFAMLRGRYRYRLLLKTRRDILPQNLVRDWLIRVRRPAAVRVTVDIDPQNFV